MAAAKPQPRRNRERIRRKPLVADTTTAMDLSNVKPHLALKPRGAGRKVWEHYTTETPFWWNSADITALTLLCSLMDDIDQARKDDTSASGLSTLYKEARQMINELGATPTARTRLKMTEAQSSIAAKKVEALEEKQRKQRSGPIDVDELLDDG